MEKIPEFNIHRAFNKTEGSGNKSKIINVGPSLVFTLYEVIFQCNCCGLLQPSVCIFSAKFSKTIHSKVLERFVICAAKTNLIF